MEDKLSYDLFIKKIVSSIKDYLPADYSDAEVSVNKVCKNNDVVLDGLTIKSSNSNISPCIYLNSFYDDYLNKDYEMSALLDKIAKIRIDHNMELDFDTRHIIDYSMVKDRIVCRLINAESNAELLKDRPYKLIDDLCVTYHVALGNFGDGSMSCPITWNVFEQYGIDLADLHETALENTSRLFPPTFKGISETLGGMMLGESTPDFTTANDFMYVVSNKSGVNGASTVLNTKFMDSVSERFPDGYYILPSSIHEVLIVPASPNMDISFLKNMVHEVNSNEVSPEEILSDHVYEYNVLNHELHRADQDNSRSLSSAQDTTVFNEVSTQQPLQIKRVKHH